jgi:DMSO/TMAO reductase YedYZ molybdopterin-dependent catalytic subunit
MWTNASHSRTWVSCPHQWGHTAPVGFFDRNRKQLAERGLDPDRLPPGQYLTDRFPVLHVGDVPTYGPGQWDLTISGLVDQPFTIGLDELQAMPSVTLTYDIHCVTKWSKFDTTWTGVRVRDLLARAGVRAGATHVIEHAEYGYTTNLPLADIGTDEALVAWQYEGEPIEPIHGGPVRIVVPHLYFWKSAKWVRTLEVVDADRPGFWERNGYHMYGDPFTEQRHWGD